MKKFLLLQILLPCVMLSNSQIISPSFNAPDTVCINADVNIQNTSVGGSSFFWSFCSADINTVTPEAVNLGNISGNLSQPVFMDYAYYNNNYYGFLMNHIPGGLVRLDFGNSLLNTPTSVNLGDFGGIVPSANGSEGIQIVQNNGKWYAIIVGGNASQGTNPRVLKIDFGTDLANPTPVATDWGNIGNLSQPIDLHVFQEGNNWYGLTVNAENNTFTRFNFTNSFDNVPTAVNLGNIGGLAYPTGIYAVDDNGFWRVFVTNAGSSSDPNPQSTLTRLDFGNSLLNTPTGINLGSLNNALHQPRDLTIIRSCGETIGLIVNGDQGYNDVVKINFNQDFSSMPDAFSLGNFGNLSFPHSISKLFRVKESVYGFITNVTNNTLTRLKFSGCSNSDFPTSADRTPNPVKYAAPGIYNISLTVDDGLPSQSSFCKRVVVIGKPDISVSDDTSVCSNSSVRLNASGGITYTWTPSTGLDDPESSAPTALVTKDITYKVVASNNYCTSTDSVKLVLKPYPQFSAPASLAACKGTPVTLKASGGDVYLWTPSNGVSDPSSSATSVNPAVTTQYSVRIYNASCDHDTTMTTTVVVKPAPIITAQRSNDINCSVFSSQLTASGALSYSWTPAEGLDDPGKRNPVAIVTGSTEFHVVGTDVNGCSSSASVTVNVSKDGDLSVLRLPNAFTPNGDNLNDCFGIRHWGNVKVTQFAIYNRWGQIVFTTANPAECWDGTFKGKRQDAGNFMYIIKAVTFCGEVVRKGSFILIR